MTQKKCVQCGEKIVSGKGHFCSKRCQKIDLARWFQGAYSIPAESLTLEDLKEMPDSWHH